MPSVGFQQGQFEDEGRPNWDGNGPRPIRYCVWYPAEDGSPGGLMDIGPPEAPLFHMGEIAPDAPLAEAINPYPVVLLSHGTGGNAEGIGWLGCRLAARGYVAIAVSHHGNTVAEPYRAEGFLCWWERAPDLVLALDHAAEQRAFAEQLNKGRVYSAGFSLGAYTVMALLGARTDTNLFRTWYDRHGDRLGKGPREFPDLTDRIDDLLKDSPVFRESWDRAGDDYQDNRIHAALALSPAPTVRGFTEDSLAAITRPVTIICGRDDKEAPHDLCAAWLNDTLSNSNLLLLGETVGHYVFLNEALPAGIAEMPDICVDAEGVNRHAIHNQAALMADFLFSAN
ncbi:alpha/beta hydrolase family protein [Aestuariispira insulae]|uniref:Putative dienelactone hydrolase n=1 Tax=Aestuariispira insulae TaxID=1461337 RepID=A0A3D9H9N0_9PROT|nr:alpha/beta fold hydrolase [Aestuariispira insulae]RED46188.1 putative dienelactone hydrolase [Aestuariispira insulae]